MTVVNIRRFPLKRPVSRRQGLEITGAIGHLRLIWVAGPLCLR